MFLFATCFGNSIDVNYIAIILGPLKQNTPNWNKLEGNVKFKKQAVWSRPLGQI